MRHVEGKKIRTSGGVTLFQLFERYLHFGLFRFDSLPLLILEQYFQRKLFFYHFPKFRCLIRIYSESAKNQRQRSSYPVPETFGEIDCRQCHLTLRHHLPCLSWFVLFCVF
jgi:hypothetical protein